MRRPSVPPSSIGSIASASASVSLLAAPSDTGGASPSPLLGAGGELDVGLAEQRLLRRIACASLEIGANSGSISITASVVSLPSTRASSGARPTSLTLPTETPPIRTSDSTASWVASGK